ncbi:MAG: cell division protein FtsQ/DivIB [Caulobacteraceae bacterium]|nr:cell division protein FtsQ/DivIB [Caulobacteraceae bacterium]
MPAIVRGGRRDSQKPAPRKAKGARARSIPAGKLHAVKSVGLSPGATGAAVAALLLLGATVTLATGGRAQELSDAVGVITGDRLADMGFRLAKVHLEGVSPEALPAVKQAMGLYKDQPLALMDLGALKLRLEQVGWVKEVRVVRLLPDTLVIDVVERQRLAVWQHNGRASVIDAEGGVIPEADAARFPRLPLVVGEGADQGAGRIIPQVASRPRLMSRVEALVRVDDRRWDLRLKDGSLIQLPATNEDAALLRLDQLDQESRVLELGFARIDLRDPDVIAVRPRDGATVAQPTDGGA